jgi:hypothetical protein
MKANTNTATLKPFIDQKITSIPQYVNTMPVQTQQPIVYANPLNTVNHPNMLNPTNVVPPNNNTINTNLVQPPNNFNIQYQTQYKTSNTLVKQSSVKSDENIIDIISNRDEIDKPLIERKELIKHQEPEKKLSQDLYAKPAQKIENNISKKQEETVNKYHRQSDYNNNYNKLEEEILPTPLVIIISMIK